MKTLIGLLAALLAIASPVANAADPRDSGPLAIVITYHATPANRAAFRKAMEESEAAQFRRWKDEGVLLIDEAQESSSCREPFCSLEH